MIAGFVLFVAAKGRLTTYANVLWGDTTAQLPTFYGVPLLTVKQGTGTGTAAPTSAPQLGGPGEGSSSLTSDAGSFGSNALSDLSGTGDIIEGASTLVDVLPMLGL